MICCLYFCILVYRWIVLVGVGVLGGLDCYGCEYRLVVFLFIDY